MVKRYWESENALSREKRSSKLERLVRKNRAAFEGQRQSMEAWNEDDFISIPGRNVDFLDFRKSSVLGYEEEDVTQEEEDF